MFGLKSHFHSEQNQLQQGVLYWHDFNLSYTQQKNIKAERSLQPFYKQSLSWILVKCVTFVEDVVMLEEWKCNPSTSTANGLQGLKFMRLLEEDERSGRKKWYCSFLLLPLIQHVNSSLS